jgi:hypothetical protein
MLESSFKPPADRSQNPSSRRRYQAFLGLYWLTAPMAWLYAIPVERFFDASGSVRANLLLLGVVSVWRVLLMMRVVYVVYRRTVMSSMFVVLLFADLVAMAVFWLTPLPILSIMGGIRLTESEQVIQSIGFMVRFWGVVTLPVWLFGHLVTRARDSRSWAMQDRWCLGEFNEGAATKRLWGAAVSAVAVWLLVLPTTQREQRHRSIAETLLQSGRVDEAVRYMSAHNPSEFPPHWDPPPRIGYGERVPNLVDVLLVCESADARDWVRAAYREKLLFQSRADAWSYQLHAVRLPQMSDRKMKDYIGMLRSWPRGGEVAAYHKQEVESMLKQQHHGEPETVGLPEERRALLQKLLTLASRSESEE